MYLNIKSLYLQLAFKHWKFTTFDIVLHKNKELVARLGGIQRTIYSSNNVEGLKRLERKLHDELNDILKKEELMWFQRSRAKWLSDGDMNTKYYHIKTVARRRKKYWT
jgi:hypothetical protein